MGNYKFFIFISLLLVSLSFVSALESYEVKIPQTPGLVWMNQDMGANCEFINSSTLNQYNPMNTPVSVALANKSYLDKFFELYNFEGRRYNVAGFTPTTQRFFSSANVNSCFISSSGWNVPSKAIWQQVFSGGFNAGVSSLGLTLNQRYWTSNWLPFGNGNGVLELYLNNSFNNVTEVISPAPTQVSANFPNFCKNSWNSPYFGDSQKVYSTPFLNQWTNGGNIFPGFVLNGNVSCPLALYRYVRCENEGSRKCQDNSTFSVCSQGNFINVSCDSDQYCSNGQCKCNVGDKKCLGTGFSVCNASGEWENQDCTAGTECISSENTVTCQATCRSQNGNICDESQRCDGSAINAVDSNRCCNGNCVAPTPKTCSQCGEGLFNVCTKNQCENLVQNPFEGCVFIPRLVGGICISASQCTSENCLGKELCSNGICKNVSYVESCGDLTNDNTYYILANSVNTSSHETWTPISSCANINEPGKYYLSQDIDYATPFCLNINTNDVSLDLNGKSIIGTNEDAKLYPFNLVRTCQDLQNINQDPSGHYVLANDLDCSGFAFSSLGDFYGILDGFGHRVINLDISSGTWGGSFIDFLGGSLKNIRFEGNILLGNQWNAFAFISSNGGIISNVYVNFSNQARRGFVRHNNGKIEDAYVNMNLPSNIGGLVEMNALYYGEGQIINSYSANGGLVGTNDYYWWHGTITSSSYGGSGSCVASGSSNGCTLQVLNPPQYDPRNIDDYATFNSAVLINGVEKVSLRNLGNITGFSRKVSYFNTSTNTGDYAFPTPDLKFKFEDNSGIFQNEIFINWTARDSDRYWQGVASSGDGTKLVAIVSGGKIYTSSDSGLTWTPRDSDRNWQAVASSFDGTKLVAVDIYGQDWNGGYIYTSDDSGLTWKEQNNLGFRYWQSVASSGDGTKLVAADIWGNEETDWNGGYIYTSSDSGVTWTAQKSAGAKYWQSVASSSDGTKLVAAESGGQIYTSRDSGVTWTAHDSNRAWQGVASSSDGTKLVAITSNEQIYTSSDSGETWNANGPTLSWKSVASSGDGTKLVAVASDSKIYTSNDSGANWVRREYARNWQAVASSHDGTKLVAAVSGAQIYTINPLGEPSKLIFSQLDLLDSVHSIEGKVANSSSRTYGSPHYTSLPIALNNSFFVSGVDGKSFNITNKLIYFDGTSLDWLNQVNKPKSICMWVKKDNFKDNNPEVFFSMGYPWIHGIVLGSLGDSLVFSSKSNLNQSFSDGYPWNGLTYPHFFKDSNWNQVCLVDEGLDKNIVLYGNGVELRSKLSSNDAYTIWSNYYNTGHIYDVFFGVVDGSYNGYPGYLQSNWKGEIDEAMLWSQALTADEIKNLYFSYSYSSPAYVGEFPDNYCFGLSGKNIIFDGNNQAFAFDSSRDSGVMKLFDSSNVTLKNFNIGDSPYGISIENSKSIQVVDSAISSMNSPLRIVASELTNFSGNRISSKDSNAILMRGSSFDVNIKKVPDLGNVSVEASRFFVYNEKSGLQLPAFSFEDSNGFKRFDEAISVQDRSFIFNNDSKLYSELKGERITFETNTVDEIPHFGDRAGEHYPQDQYGSSILTFNNDTYYGVNDKLCLSQNYYMWEYDGIKIYDCMDSYSNVAKIVSTDSNNRGYFDKPFKLEVTLN